MRIEKSRFNYITHLTIERITQYLKDTLEESGLTVRKRESSSSESMYLHVFYFQQFYTEIRISNHDPKTAYEHDISASFDRRGAINCHEFLIQFLDSLHLPIPEQTMNYQYVQNILHGLKNGTPKKELPKNIIVKAKSQATITVTKRANS